MKKGLAILTGVVFGLVLFTGGAMAYDYSALGENITISDEDSKDSGWSWYGAQEDQENEPGTNAGQNYDLEAFFLDADNAELSMVMGYDFKGNKDQRWDAGDIYFELGASVHEGTSDAQFGMGAHNPNDDSNYQGEIYDRTSDGYDSSDLEHDGSVNYNWGYNLVFDIDFGSFSEGVVNSETGFTEYTFNYDVVSLNENSYNLGTHYKNFDESGAWRYDSGGDVLEEDMVGTYLMGLDDGVGITGGSHNVVTVDLAGFVDPTTFVSHFTMECGNDNLMGDPVPEPSTIILLGLGILGLVGFRKKFVK
ncbi:PEP-CTERM sorting domain-containing protein [Desulfococcaceae bacterium HSG7]|nr:PEP-CTERM sorting domain-containing protein [Desulfococcaceae bacterium HSG7]